MIGDLVKMKKPAQKILQQFTSPEQLVYTVVWAVVFLIPIVENFFEWLSAGEKGMQWQEIFIGWLSLIPFLFLFIVHNRFLLPFLLVRKRIWFYICSSIVLTVALMMAVSSLQGPTRPERRFDTPREFRMPRPEPPQASFPNGSLQKPPQHKPHPSVLQRIPIPVLARIVLALLMLCFNVAVRLFFKSLRDKEAMKELERQNLQSQLEYLKYQINPHFFMNTLNNIHALVDIDAEKAKQIIVELSRLMRYVLYESNNRTILLEKEVQFLKHYVELMRIRYPESVHIALSLPEETHKVSVPPLLFISFVENAFKHGVSYQKESYISISLKLEEGKVVFHSLNSCSGRSEDQHHGIGLENIRKRLNLLFGEEFTLVIEEKENTFEVLLRIPA